MDGGEQQRSTEYGVSLAPGKVFRVSEGAFPNNAGPPGWLPGVPGTINWGRPLHLCFVQLVDAMVMPLRMIGKGLRNADTIDFKA